MSSGGLRLRFPAQQKDDVADPEMADTPSRRTTRVRNKPRKFGDYMESSPSKRRSYKDFESSDEEMVEEVNQPTIKPTALFSNDDVGGQDMFQFKSRHTKLDLQNKVKTAISNSPKISDSPKTPRKTGLTQTMQNSMSNKTEATPRHVKNIIKKRIIQEVERQSSASDDSDFSGGSSSDFAPDGTDNESASSASESEQEGSAEQAPSKPAQKQQLGKQSRAKTRGDSEYYVTPDNYFMMHSTKKITTSDHTLARLKDLNLEETQDIQISDEHRNKLSELRSTYSTLFDRWLYALSENFNIVLYGIGSKRSVLHQFQTEKLKHFPCVVVNGFFPSITVKSILESIVVDLLGNSHVPSNIGDVVSLIDGQLTESGVDLFLIVHNIDGAMLRSAKAQAALASISQIRNVHTIATIDHINAPLLWDHTKLSKLRFTWWDVTTLARYAGEAWPLGGAHASRDAALPALRAVHRALTHNAKGIYRIIVGHQLQHAHNYTGLSFKELYSKSREQFLVSSDLALRAQLTEFLDHKLVRMRRAVDGSETLVIPIDNAVLRMFLDEQDS